MTHDRLPPARGAAALKVLVLLVIIGVAAYAGAYAYGSLHLSSMEAAFSRRLVEAKGSRGPEDLIDADVVRERLIAIARQEGLEVAPEDVQVTIAPLDNDNIEKLASFERAALGIAAKLPNHEIGAMFLGMRVTARAKWGPVKREVVLERNTWVHKGIVR